MKQKSKKPEIEEGDFYETIQDALKAKRHVEYLHKIMLDYERYKEFFNKIFTDINSRDAVYLFRATYLLKKSVWREIVILGNQTFEDLAEAIIYSMDWENDHMHAFGLPEDLQKKNWNFYKSPFAFYASGWEDDPYPTYKSTQIKIADLNYKIAPRLQFVFDFGDGHIFDIELKKIDKVKKRESEENFPMFIDQRGISPEQYPDLEKNEFHDHEDNGSWFHEDCKLCQDLKSQGVDIQLIYNGSLMNQKTKSKPLINLRGFLSVGWIPEVSAVPG